MLSVMAHGPDNYCLEVASLPKLTNARMLIKVKAVGVCASDLKCYQGKGGFWNNLSKSDVPFVPGHEFVGEIVEINPSENQQCNFRIGDRIVSEQIIPCRNCKFCIQGKHWMCMCNKVYGFPGGPSGAMTEYMIIPGRATIYKVPNNITDECAAMIEPVACAIHAVQRADVRLSAIVVIAGAGPIGLFILQIVRLVGSSNKIIMLDTRDDRLKLAKKLGANECIDVVKEDSTEKINCLTNKEGCDIYFEVTGSPESVTQGLQIISRSGTYVQVGIFERLVTIDWNIVGDYKELSIYGSHLSPYCYPLAIRCLEQRLINVEEVISHVLPLKEFREAFNIAIRKPQGLVKVILIPR